MSSEEDPFSLSDQDQFKDPSSQSVCLSDLEIETLSQSQSMNDDLDFEPSSTQDSQTTGSIDQSSQVGHFISYDYCREGGKVFLVSLQLY